MKASLINSTLLLSAGSLLLTTGCAPGLRKGTMAPDFTLKNMTGQDFSLSDYSGNVVLLAYWAVG